jgi:hypothetical protein
LLLSELGSSTKGGEIVPDHRLAEAKKFDLALVRMPDEALVILVQESSVAKFGLPEGKRRS